MKRRTKPNITLQSWLPTRILLFINFVTASLVVFAAGAASLRYPIGLSFNGILIGTLVCSVAIIVPFRRLIVGWQLMIVLAIVAILSIVWPSLSFWGVARTSTDTGNYVTLAQYYLRYPDGTDSGLSPIDQYASSFSGTRFATPAILGIFAQFWNGDAGSALVPFSGFLLVNVFAGFTTLARYLRCRLPISLLAGVFAVFLGWVPNMLYAGSLDNLLFMALVPFLLVRLFLVLSGRINVRSILGLGVCGAAVVYTYPEGLALSTIVFAPVFMRVLQLAGRRRFGYLKLGLAVLLTLVLVLPYGQTFFSFLLRQINVSNHLRVGDSIFPGLVTRAFLPSAFALGEEFPGVVLHVQDTLLSIALVLLMGGGLVRLYRQNSAFVWAFVLFFCLVLWQAVVIRYSYGFYKVLTIGSILVIPAIFAGVEELYFRCTGRFRLVGPLILGCLLTLVVAAVVWRNYNFTPKWLRVSLEPYSDLRNLRKVTQNGPVCLMCDDDFDQQWARIYLRDLPQEMRFQRGIDLFPAMMRAKKEAAAKFFLVNRKMEGAVWGNSKFWLLPISDKIAPIVAVDSPNGIEEVEGAAFTWLSDRPTSFVIDSSRDGPAILWAEKVRMGLSRPEDSIRTVIVRDASGTTEHKVKEVKDAFYMCLFLNKGLNHLEMWCAEKPTVKRLRNGDTRAMLLGLEDYQVKPISSELNLVGVVRSPNGLESYQGTPFLWLANEPTVLLITSPGEENGILAADKVILGPSSSGLTTRSVMVKGENSETESIIKDSFSIPISLKPGLNRVEIWCTDVPAVRSLPNGEARVLLLGLVNYRIKEAAK
jgi:hypothetical protein